MSANINTETPLEAPSRTPTLQRLCPETRDMALYGWLIKKMRVESIIAAVFEHDPLKPLLKSHCIEQEFERLWGQDQMAKAGKCSSEGLLMDYRRIEHDFGITSTCEKEMAPMKAKYDEMLAPYIHPADEAILETLDDKTLNMLMLGLHRRLGPYRAELDYILKKRWIKTYDRGQLEKEFQALEEDPMLQSKDTSGRINVGATASRAVKAYARYATCTDVLTEYLDGLNARIDRLVAEYEETKPKYMR
ncbi:MAG: hypothetical protein Q9202_007331 [Teloschistes flavicans]